MNSKNNIDDIIKSPTTTEELANLLRSATAEKTEYAPEKYKYVIYVRKSTDEASKQVRSLEDQITECKEFAERNGFSYTSIIQEAESAKEAGIRPKFRKMLEDVGKGVYDGVIAWHPDRLSRNMKEAGEIIDLIDKNIIRDLKFVSFTFTNDTSGKMLLGITFAISKEYSDKLSENVLRGNRLSLEEGKYINRPKHGYIKDKNNCLRPDGQNFVLIKECFQMRLAGKTLDEIAEFLAQNNYQRMSKNQTKVYKNYKKNAIDRILKDPVYCGVLCYGSEVVELQKSYDFIPVVTVEEFMSINHLKDREQVFKMAKKYKRPEYKKADLMSEMVFCGACGEKMTAGITSKKTRDGKTKYFYYRCNNDFCQYNNKSVRAKVILDYVYEYLDTKPFSSKQAYEHYKDEIKRVMDLRTDNAQREKRMLVAQINKQKERAESIRDNIYKEIDEIIKDSYKKDLIKAEGEVANLQDKLDKVNMFLNTGKTAILNYERFIELMDNMAKTLRNLKNMKELDYFMQKIYLNFYVERKKVVKSTLNQPFEALSKLNVSKSGR